jgi:hypothetical protein
MTAILTDLIREAAHIAAPDDCGAHGHAWESDGGRSCPRGADGCSQTVYRCTRCGEYDYGDKGGPAHAECYPCPTEWRFTKCPT